MLENKNKNLTKLEDFGEFNLIDLLTKDLKIRHKSTIKSIGDDAAVLDYKSKKVLVSTDFLVEGVHFDMSFTPLKHLGYKSVIVNISDIYAMNAIPTHITVNLGISSKYTLEAIDELYDGILLACKKYKVDWEWIKGHSNNEYNDLADNLATQAIQAGAFGSGREGVQRAEYQAASDRNRAALQAGLLQQGFGQAQTAAQQAFDQQRGLASLQPSLAATSTQQLGSAGTGALAYSQALKDATQQQAQLAYQEPYTRLGILGSGIASQAGGVPTTTQTQAPAPASASPLSQALQVGLTAYGLGSIFGGN